MNNGKKTILLTGATGFIGHNLLAALAAEGYAVRILARNAGSVSGFTGNADLFEGDLLKPETLAGIEQDIDIVIHCAGMLGKWGTDEALIRQTNVAGSVNLLRRFGTKPLHRFIYLSAGGVTGPIAAGIADESTVCRPVTAYERSKFATEQQLRQCAGECGLPLIIIRPTFTYGPGDTHKLPLFKAVQQRRFAFIGDGKSLLSPVYIDDLISGILRAMQLGKAGETYIISGDRPASKEELVFTIADALMVPRPKLRIPYRVAWLTAAGLEKLAACFHFQPLITRSKVMMMGDNFGYSCQKAQNTLSYQPQTTLKQGIVKTITDYKKQGLL